MVSAASARSGDRGGVAAGSNRAALCPANISDEYPAVLQVANASRVAEEDRRRRVGPVDQASVFRGLLRPRRALSLALYPADDGNSGAGRRRTAIVVTSPRPHSATLAAAALLGITRCIAAAERKRLRVAYGTETVGRSTRSLGPGNTLCYRGQKAGELRLRHRHAGRAYRGGRLLRFRPDRFSRLRHCGASRTRP